MTEKGTSGKRVVAVLLGLALAAGVIALIGARLIEKETWSAMQEAAEGQSASVLSEGVLYEAQAGDPGVVFAKDVGSGKELWRAELGAVTTTPAVLVHEEVIEVQIAGTPWMTLDRASGEPVD